MKKQNPKKAGENKNIPKSHKSNDISISSNDKMS